MQRGTTLYVEYCTSELIVSRHYSYQCWDSYFLNVTRYILLQLNYLVTVTYYPYDKVTIIILHILHYFVSTALSCHV